MNLGGGEDLVTLDVGSQSADASVEVQAFSVDDEGNLIEDYSDVGSAISAQGLDDEVDALSANGVKTIVLDAGHGGSDGGAEGYGLTESKLTLAIATACRDELSKYGRAKVIMTRSDDSYVDLKDRAKIATDAGADFFVSFHINAGGGSGAEVWIPNKSSWYSSYHELGSELGDKVLEKLKALGLSSRGNQWKSYPAGESSSTYPDGSAADYLSVIRNCRAGGVPAILIEHGFIDNEHDANLLSSASYLKQLGVADAQAIVDQLGLKEAPLYGFNDVFASTDHSAEIGWLASSGISEGYPDGSFGGMRGVARCDMAAFLYRLAGSPSYVAPSKSPFKDVTSSTDHYKEICWLADTGISEGWAVSGSKEFRPKDTVTRADMAAFLRRFYKVYSESAQFKDWTASGKARLRFSDVSENTSHSDDIWWMGATGISSGYSDGSYGVGSVVKRQDLAEFLYRLYVRCFRASNGYLIMGSSSYKATQFIAAFKASGKAYPSAVYSSKGASSIEEFVEILVSEAEAEGVKADVVFAQAMHETGWLQFGGDVKADQCNFAGIGATGSGAPGNSFNDVRTGLRAQVQHLKAYASTDALKNACVDPRFGYVTRGCATTLGSLAGQWATDSSYGRSIYSLIVSLSAL